MLRQRVGDGDRPVLAAGAADGDHQLGFALLNIQRDQVIQHRIQVPQKDAGILRPQHKILHRLVQPGLVL
mgnify:CR=1 FL=1